MPSFGFEVIVHRVAEVRTDLRRSPLPAPCPSRVTPSCLTRTVSGWFLCISCQIGKFGSDIAHHFP